MAKIKIYLSPSDQTKNRYKVGNTTEAAVCREIADLCVVALKRCGFDAKSNRLLDMWARVRESNSWGADAHIPIHTNAFNEKVAGFRGFYYKDGNTGHKIVKAIMAAVAPITPGTSDGLSPQPGLYEVKASNAPCAYLELGFHDNAQEAQYILDHKADLAEAICKGLCKHFNVKYIAPNSAPEKAPEKAPETKGDYYTMKMRSMSKGNSGEDVKALQILLNGRGYNCGSVDGIFGSKTDSAVRNYQKAKKLTVDGIAGPATMGSLMGV